MDISTSEIGQMEEQSCEKGIVSFSRSSDSDESQTADHC